MHSISIHKRKEGPSEMKNKLSVLLVSLLLCLTLFPAEASAASTPPAPAPSSAVSEAVDPETEEYSEKLEIPESPALQPYVLVQSENPGWPPTDY